MKKPKPLTWEKATEKFRGWCSINVSPKTAAMYENSLRALDPSFGSRTLAAITPAMVERFKADRSAQVSIPP